MSFEFEISDSDRARSEVIGAVGSDLQALYAKRKREDGLTQQQVADVLDVDKSRINRCLTGYANLTLGTTADLTRAIRGKILIKIVPEEEASRWAIHFACATNSSSNNIAIVRNKDEVRTDVQQVASGVWR